MNARLRLAVVRIVLGVCGGLAAAAVFSSIAALVWIINGGSLGVPGVHLKDAVTLYVTWGIVVGAAGGALFPVLRHPVIAFVAGGTALDVLYLAVTVIYPAAREGLPFVLVIGCVVGGVAGVWNLVPHNNGDPRAFTNERG